MNPVSLTLCLFLSTDYTDCTDCCLVIAGWIVLPSHGGLCRHRRVGCAYQTDFYNTRICKCPLFSIHNSSFIIPKIPSNRGVPSNLAACFFIIQIRGLQDVSGASPMPKKRLKMLQLPDIHRQYSNPSVFAPFTAGHPPVLFLSRFDICFRP